MENTDKISRRGFLKVSGMAGVTAALASSCGHSGEKAASEVPKGQMTYRQLPGNGDRVSLLGYGCMRWPQVKGSDGNDVIDQEAVNALVDYALEHGVNYFDTAPTYLRGFSENATGTALKRHPRDKYFIATKLSNFANPSREFAMEMYRQSFIDLQTDYIDYYLLHSIGRSMEDFRKRYIDNGMLDFLIEERKAGRIRHLGWSFHGEQEVFDYVLSMHEDIHWDFVQIQLNYPRERQCRIPLRRVVQERHPLHHHGAPARRPPVQRPGPHRRPPQGAGPAEQRRLMGIPLRRIPGDGADRPQRHDLHGAPAGQPPHLFSFSAADRRGQGILRGDSPPDARVPHHSLQRLQVLHALPLRHRHPRSTAALQQMRQ